MDAAPTALVARRRLTTLERPFVVCVLTDTTASAAAATLARALYAGADAFELNLPLLAEEDPGAVSALVQQCPRPIYTSCRRASFMTVYGRGPVPDWDDDERMLRQLELLASGTVAVDVELDAFGADRGDGVADDDSSVAGQRAVAAAAHAGGGEVLFSCHTRRVLGPDEVVALAAEAEARGADLFKLVAAAPTTEDALGLVAGAVRLRRQGALPTTIVASGRAGRFTRVVAPVLGAGWALCQEDIFAGGFAEQPPVGETRDVLRLLSALEGVPGG